MIRFNTNAPVFGKGVDEVQETAVIVEVRGETAKVRLNRNPACESCASAGFCHPDSGNKPLVEVNNEVHADVGDVVELEVKPSSRIGSSLIVFGLPLVMMLLGAILGLQYSGSSQDGAVVGAVAGLALGLLLVNVINRIMRYSARMRPRAIRIVSSHG